MEKEKLESGFSFRSESARVASDIMHFYCLRSYSLAMSQSVRGNFDSYVRNLFVSKCNAAAVQIFDKMKFGCCIPGVIVGGGGGGGVGVLYRGAKIWYSFFA